MIGQAIIGKDRFPFEVGDILIYRDTSPLTGMHFKITAIGDYYFLAKNLHGIERQHSKDAKWERLEE